MKNNQIKIENVVITIEGNKLSYLLPDYMTTYKFKLFKKRNKSQLLTLINSL